MRSGTAVIIVEVMMAVIDAVARKKIAKIFLNIGRLGMNKPKPSCSIYFLLLTAHRIKEHVSILYKVKNTLPVIVGSARQPCLSKAHIIAKTVILRSPFGIQP